MSLIPLLPFTVVFILGILTQGIGVGVFFMFVPLAVALCALLLRRGYVAIMALSFTVGYAVAYINQPPPLQSRMMDRELDYSGVVSALTDYDSGRGLIVEIDSCEGMPCGKILVKAFIPSSLPVVDETDRIDFSASLTPLVHKPDLPDGIDFGAHLRREGVVAECLIRPGSIEAVRAEPGFINSIRRLRGKITGLIASSSLGSSSKEFLNAIMTGDRSMLSSDTREIFSSTGLSHMLALSGLHVGLLTWLISMMLFPLWICGMKRTRVVLIIILIWLFAVMTGLSPSVVRATVMATVFLISIMMERVRSPFNSLCFAAVVILVFSPSSIYTVGFQLSFLAVAAILIFAERFNPVGRRHVVWHGVLSYPSVTLAAMLGTGFVSAYYFNIFPLYFIPANFIGALLLPPILVCGVVFIVADVCGLEYEWLGRVIDSLVDILVGSEDWLSRLPGAVSEIYVPPLSVVAWLLALGALAFFLYRRGAAYGIAVVLLAVFAVSYAMLLSSPACGIESYIVKGGRHTSILIRENAGFQMVSTAPSHELMAIREEHEERYRKYMLKRGIDSISILPLRYVSANVRRDSDIITVGSRKFALVAGKEAPIDTIGQHVDYAVVCSGFRGEILDIVRQLRADTIVLSSDLNKRRHDRYYRELLDASVPVFSLRDRGVISHDFIGTLR